MKPVILIASLILIFRTETSSAQTFEWAKQFGNWSSVCIPYSITTDAQGNVYRTGSFSGGNLDIDPGPGTHLVSTYGKDAFVTKQNSNGDLLWVAQVKGTSTEDEGYYIKLDEAGNIYVTGWFNQTADFDPGPDVYNLTTHGVHDIFIWKLNGNGGFEWAKGFGGSTYDWGNGLDIDDAGNVYATGSFRNDTADFDPGPGVFNMIAIGDDGYILKLDVNGNFVWAKQFTGPVYEWGTRLELDGAGNIFILGAKEGTSDMDPGPGVYSLPSYGDYDAFVCKLTNNGDFVWVKQFGGPTFDMSYGLCLDTLANVYITGYFQATADFDPDTSVFNLTATGRDPFIVKLDSTGDLQWAKNIAGAANGIGYMVRLDHNQNVYTSGVFEGSTDFDPGAGSYLLAPQGNVKNSYINKLDNNGNFISGYQFGGVTRTVITIDAEDNIYATGNFRDTADFNPDSTLYELIAQGTYYPSFVLKLSPDSCAGFAVDFDSISAISCSAAGYIEAHAVRGALPYNYAWNTTPVVNDSILNPTVSGVYTLQASDARGCTQIASIYMPGPALPGSFDLQSNLIATSFRTGFPATLWIDALNEGCTATDGQLKLVMDDQVIYSSAIPSPDLINGDTLIWNFSQLNCDSAHITPQIFTTTSNNAQAGSSVCFKTIITPIGGDADTSNNVKTYCYTVINGYDPNDKKVYPVGACTEGFIKNDQLLTYTVRFQNTGNASAINIHLIDSIDSDLDISTFKLLGYSHAVTTQILPGNTLKFIFDNINLPDSLSDEANSHGYVVFEIMPRSALATSTQLTNEADIYFDFNPEIITNRVLNTIAYPTFGMTGSHSAIACHSYTVNGTTYTSGGIYIQSIPDALGCDSTIQLNLTINIVDVSVTDNTPFLTANAVGAAYQWLDCSGAYMQVVGETNQSFTTPVNGMYAVQVSQNNCTDTSSCYVVSNVGILNNSFNNELIIYPNPSNGKINIDFGNPQTKIELRIQNSIGMEISKETYYNENSLKLDLHIEPGVYFIYMKNNTGDPAILKIVIY